MESMDDPSAFNCQNVLASVKNELTDSSAEESDSENSTGSRPNDFMAKTHSKEEMAVCGLPRVPHH